MKPAHWLVVLYGFVTIVFITGSQAARPRMTPYLDTQNPTLTTTLTPTSTPTSTPVQIVIEEPEINPAYGEGMCDSYWYRYLNERGHNAYLTLNVNSVSTNWGEWRTTLPEAGCYLVEAFIPTHPELLWDCPPSPPRLIPLDTSDANYTIQHEYGQTHITATQKALNNGWIPLGEYTFLKNSQGSVILSDITDEVSLSTTVSFSAIRFTWQRPSPAMYFLPIISMKASAIITDTVGIQNAPALDQCHLPTPAQMQTWWNYSPYRITNVYIGGGLLYHECTVPDAIWIDSIQEQGWGIIPTWVGPQAPCSGWKLRMNADPTIAYQQGQVEADAASQAAWQIGLTGTGMGGTVIYYDIENFNPANTACRAAVKSFIDGWTERLHYWGNRAGAYGGSCTSYVSDWATVAHQPDNLWVAAWNYSRYNDAVSLFDITCLSNSLWPNHQRIRQYTTGHNETWGNVTFNIDSNIADAEVVIPTHAMTDHLSTLSFSSNNLTISDLSGVKVISDQNLLTMNGKLYRFTSQDENWLSSPIILPEMAIRNTSFVNRWQGWIITNTEDGVYRLFTTSNGGDTWLEIAAPINDFGWIPLSIQFTDLHNGWIVEKQLTRSNFSMGRLHRTHDGGNSWETLDLPLGEEVRFLTQEHGWIAGGVGGSDLYQTRDGGSTWDPVLISLPEDTETTLSLPAFSDHLNGILPMVFQKKERHWMQMYVTYDGGETWHMRDTPLSLPNGIVRLDFISPQVGMGITSVGSCRIENDIKNCMLDTSLWFTQDGGNTWKEMDIP